MRDATGAGRLDTTALTTRPGAGEVARFREESRRAGAPWSRLPQRFANQDQGVGQVLRSALPLCFVLLVLALPVVVAGPRLVVEGVAAARRAGPTWMLGLVGFVGLVAAVVLLTAWRLAQRLQALVLPTAWWADELRLTRFAAANDLRYGHEEPVDLPGVIFRHGRCRTAERRLTTRDGAVEIGVYRYEDAPYGARQEEVGRVVRWGYVAVRLGATLPNLLVDGRANDGRTLGFHRSNLPLGLGLRRDQRVSLGPAFDPHFAVYAPPGYGGDAQQILAPDVCAALVEHARDADLEVVDDTLFGYAPAFDLLDPATYARAGVFVETVGALVRRQAQRYTDPRGPRPPEPGGPGEEVLPAVEVTLDRLSDYFPMRDRGDAFLRRVAENDAAGRPPIARRTPAAPGGVGRGGRRLDRTRPVLGMVIAVPLIAWYVWEEFLSGLVHH